MNSEIGPRPNLNFQALDVPRVLHVVGAMNRAGAEAMLMTLYRGIDRSRLQFDFLEFSDEKSDFSDEILAMGGRIIRISWSQSLIGSGGTVSRLMDVMREYGPFAAVHSHILFATGAVMVAARKAGVPVRIAHSHNTADVDSPNVVRRLYHFAARRAIRWGATSFVACGEDAGRYLFGSRHVDDVVVIPNSVDTSRYRPVSESERASLRREIGLREDGLVLVSVARFEPVKNHEFLLKLARELKSHGVVFEMLLVGAGSLWEKAGDEVRGSGLEDVVRMLGLRDDVERILQCADAFLMPSHFEGLPVVLVESQAVGLPSLVSDRVTREVGLGLGIVKFLPIDDAAVWANAVAEGFPPRPSTTDIAEAFDAKGYSTRQALARLLPLYGLADS